MQNEILRHCRRFPIVPVLTFADIGRAVEMCGALLEGGAAVLEITFRTEAAAAALAAVAAAYPQAVVAAGSVRTAEQLRQARDAGAVFAVSPGTTPALLEADILPLLPAAATGSEIMRLDEQGYRFIKFFPAVAMGGAAALTAFYGPLAEVVFCPTGGINPHNADEFLALPNVACVGGSWLVHDGDNAKAVYEKTRAAGKLAVSKEEKAL